MNSSHLHYDHFHNGYSTLDSEPSVGQAPVPMADMTGSSASQDAPAASAERDLELDTILNDKAEKANKKRDLEDGDFTPRKRRPTQVSAATATKRQRQATGKTSETSGPATISTKAFDDCDEATKAQRADAVQRLQAIWGSDLRTWPVFDFGPWRPVAVQKGHQRGQNAKEMDDPHNWSLGLLNEIHHLAKNIDRRQHHRIEEVLQGVIRNRVGDAGSDKTMSPHDIQCTYNKLVQEQAEAGPSHRSPTITAAVTNNRSNDGGGGNAQSHPGDKRVDSPLLSGETAIQPGGGQTSKALETGSIDHDFIERFIDDNVENNKRYMEIMQDIMEEKERHHLAISEKRQRWRTGVAPRK
ncbi:hypothetical protein PRZ48_011493 [Zasmidium cellare]|uniref:Uncharacterized protein n=1 Tax=Zasmidium cellare TaxID=395010 RepID=A0ABR0E6I1_ZASCE|nr:hypothetical protein PRZ48_011493 [Zasmidium cellare]